MAAPPWVNYMRRPFECTMADTTTLCCGEREEESKERLRDNARYDKKTTRKKHLQPHSLTKRPPPASIFFLAWFVCWPSLTTVLDATFNNITTTITLPPTPRRHEHILYIASTISKDGNKQAERGLFTLPPQLSIIILLLLAPNISKKW